MCDGCQSAECAKLIADQFPSSQLELFRVSAQRVRFGQQADDVRFIRGLNHGERLRFRVFENRDRLHATTQPTFPALDGSLGFPLGLRRRTCRRSPSNGWRGNMVGVLSKK
jgi:hypothetical protein